jgi:glycerol-3-phosphate dehydrogenase
LRPLLRAEGTASPSDMSRRHSVGEGPSGLLTVTGGKLTTFRRMAKDVVDRVVARDSRHARCRTAEIPLGSSRPFSRQVADVSSVGGELAELLVKQYGAAAADVVALAGSGELSDPLSPAAAHIAAEVVYAARHEGAATLADVLSRRTRLALRARDAALPTAPLAAALLARELGHPDDWAAAQVSTYADSVRAERGALDLQA